MAGTGVFKSAAAETTSACLLCLLLTIVSVQSAPAAYPEERFLETTELAEYGNLGGSGAGAGPGGGLVEPSDCYYNFQRYAEGDRIVTNEPCLNCTCHSRMLMCYLRVCPFSKAIGQDCKVEKRPDQCCPVITCPEVPVHLLTSTSTTEKVPSDTSVAFPDTYGCSIDGRFFPDGVQVPSNPEKPCELCYCIRNRTACVMQECTLQVEGCKPVLQPGVCCPARYDCDYSDEPSATERPPPSGLILSTPTTPGPAGCTAGGYIYHDGDRVRGRTPCEHCYCMRGDVVCAVQECGPALQGCRALPPKPGRCCADAFQCANGTVSLEILSQDQNAPEPLPESIPAGSIEDKNQQVASTSSSSAEESQTESLKDGVATGEKYEPTTAPSPSEMGTPVKGVKGEVGFEEPTTTNYKPDEPTKQPEEELPEGTTTRVQLPEVDPVKDPALPEGEFSDDSVPTTASPQIDKETVSPVESHISHDNAETDIVLNNQESDMVTTESSLPELPTTHAGDDKIEDAPVTFEPPIESHDKTTATFVTSPDVYATTTTSPAKQTCEKQGQIFELSDPVPASFVTSNPCVVNCTCQRHNAITCSVINCPPHPPHHKNCVVIRHEGVCCPTYACDGIEAPEPESDSQMAVFGDGSDEVDEVTTNAPKAEEVTMVTADYSRRTTSAEVSHFVPLKDITTTLLDNSYQPTTVPPLMESAKEPATSADKIDKPAEATPEHIPVETEQHSYDESAHSHDESAHSHDGEDIHEDSDSHHSPDHEPAAHTAVPEDIDQEAQTATDEPKKPEPIEDVATTHSEAVPSHEDGNEIDDPTQKPSLGPVKEEEHEISHPAEIPTTQNYKPDDVGNSVTSSPVLPDAAESDGGLDEPIDSEDHTISASLDHTVSPLNSESQVTTDRTSVAVESDHKGSQADNVGIEDVTSSLTTVATPEKENETISEQDKYPATEKPADVSSDVAVQPEYDAPPSSETSESSSVDESPEAEVTPTPPTQVDAMEPANINIQPTEEPAQGVLTDVPSEIPTENPGDVQVTEPASIAPSQAADDLPAATGAPAKVVYPTEPPPSFEIEDSGITTAVPEVTKATAPVHLDEKPVDGLPEETTEAPEAEPSAATDRPVDRNKEPSESDASSAGTSMMPDVTTDKPVLEKQTEKASEESSVTESQPVTPSQSEASSHDSNQEDGSEVSSGTEEPPKNNEKQPYVTVLPFEEATSEKVDGIFQDDNGNNDGPANVAPLAPEASTEDSPTQSPLAAVGTEEESSTDKPVSHFDQSTEGLFNAPTTPQSESATEIPAHAYTDEQWGQHPTTETPLKLVSSDSDSNSPTGHSTDLPERAPQPTTDSSQEEQPATTIATPSKEQDHVEDPDKVLHGHSEGTSEVSQDHAEENSDDIPHDHTDFTPIDISSDHADHIHEKPGEVEDHAEGTVAPIDHKDGISGDVAQNPINEAPIDVSSDHTDKSPPDSAQDSTDPTTVESLLDHTLGAPEDTHDDHTDGTPVNTPHDSSEVSPVEAPHAHADETPAKVSHDHTEETPAKVSHDHTEETPSEISHDHTEETPAEVSHDHTEETPAEVSHDHTEDTPAEVSHDHTEQTPAEVSHDHTEQTQAEVSHDHTEETPAEVSHDHTVETPAEVLHDHTEETPAEVSHDHTVETPAEVSHDHTEETPAEVSHDHTEETPAEVSHDHTVETPAEVSHDHTVETPAEVSHDPTVETPVEVSHDHTEESLAEVSHDHTEETPAEVSHDHTEETPAEVSHDHTEETPAEVSHDHTEETPAEVSHDHTQETPAEVSHDHTQETPAEVSHDHTEETPAEISHGHTEETPAEVSHGHTEETPAEVSHDHTEETSAEVSHDHTEETSAEVSHDHTEETPAEVSHDYTEETPAEVSHDHTEETPAEVSHDHTEETPAEVSHFTEEMPAEVSHDHTVGTPAGVSHDHTEETPGEVSHDHAEEPPADVSHDHSEGTAEISHDHTEGIPAEILQNHAEGIPTETLQDHTESATAESPEDNAAGNLLDHTEGTTVNSYDHTDGSHVDSHHTDRAPAESSWGQTDAESSWGHTDETPVEAPQDHSDGTFVGIHDHTDESPAASTQGHSSGSNEEDHTDGTPVVHPIDHPEHFDDGHEGATEGPYQSQTAHTTQAVTESPTQSQTEPSLAQTVSSLHTDSPAHDKTPEDTDSNSSVGSAESASTSGGGLAEMTTEGLGASQTTIPELTATLQSQHDDSTSAPDKPSEEPKHTEKPAEATELHTTEASITTVVPEHHANIPVENLEGPPPVVSQSQETAATQTIADDKYETVVPASSQETVSDVSQDPAHSLDTAHVGTDTELELTTTALPEFSQGHKGQTSVETSTVFAPMEPSHVQSTVGEQVVSQTPALPTEESVKESSTSADEAESATSPSPTQQKEPLSPEHTPSNGLSSQGQETTQSPTDRVTVSPVIHQQTSLAGDHEEKQPDHHATEPATHIKPEYSTYPPRQDRPTALPHIEPSSTTEHKYITTSSPVTEASSKAPFHHPGDDFETQDHYHEHDYNHNKDTVPTVPPSIFGGHIEDEHPAYESHMPTTPSHNHFGPPDDPFPVDPYTEDDDPGYGPGTCRYAGKVYVSAQQIPRDDPCDFCFCFRSDIICLQQSCPPPIPGCHEEPISGFCCPRYECPVSMATSLNLTTTSTTTTTTLPPHFLPHAYHGAATRTGCQVRGVAYRVGETVRSASGPCLHCRCGGDGQMQCEPKVCSPEPMLRKMIAAAATRRR